MPTGYFNLYYKFITINVKKNKISNCLLWSYGYKICT